MSSKAVAGVLRSKAWQALKETLINKQDKVGERLTPSVGGEGRRIFPGSSSKNDSKFQLRIDCGSTVEGSPNLMKVVLQVNKEAKEGALKSFLKASKRGTHANVAEAIIDTTKQAGDRVLDMVDQFDAASDNEDE